MPKSSRNRKRIPVTNAPLSKSASRPKAALKQVLATYTNTSSQSNQAIISSYHTLLKQLHQTQAALAEEEKISSPAHKELKSKLAEIHNSIQALGGLDAYQRASMRGGNLQKGWNVTGQWLIQTLRGRLGKEDQESPSLIVSTDKKLRLLDVGALYGDTYLKYSSWIETTSIDLNPQSHLVTKQDFFERPVPSSSSSTELAGQSMNKDKFDIVCLSLVVNFVTDPAKRGEMLQKTRAFLVDRGILYIVLPLPYVPYPL